MFVWRILHRIGSGKLPEILHKLPEKFQSAVHLNPMILCLLCSPANHPTSTHNYVNIKFVNM